MGGRCTRSRFITGITDSVIQMAMPDTVIGDSTIAELDAEQLDRRGATYAALTQVVWDQMVSEELWGPGRPNFAAQADEWNKYWKQLSGFNDSDLEQRRQLRVSELVAINKSSLCPKL